MPDSFLANALAQPRNKLFLDGEQTINYGELIEKIGQLSGYLQSQPIHKGDFVLVSVENPARFAEIFLSLVSDGIGAVVASPTLTDFEFQAFLENTKPAGVIADRALLEKSSLAASDENIRFLLPVNQTKPGGLFGRLLGKQDSSGNATGYPECLSGYEIAHPDEPQDTDLPGWVINTSGTTSDPKNVLVSRGALLHTLASRSQQYSLSETSRLMNVLPLYLGDGLGQGPLLAFFNGATWVRPCDFQAQNLPLILDSIYARQVTHFIAVPTMLSLILRLGDEYHDCFDAPHFELLVSTAALLGSELWQQFEQTFGVEITNLYALSECTTALFSGPDSDSRRIGTLGKPVGCEIRVVDPSGDDAGAEVGELWLKSPALMDGYLNNPEATTACMSDGWLRTGDLVQRDSEGFISIAGRIKEMINFAGHSINPNELSLVLGAHEEVEEASVAGILGDEWGEIPVAFVVLRPDSQLDAGTLTAFCRTRLSEYKVPRQIHFVEQFIRTAAGKVNKPAMLKMCAPKDEALPDDTDQRILSIAQSCFRSDNLPRPGATPGTEPGWDSLAHMDLLLRVEKEFSIRFSTKEIMTLETLAGIIELTNQRRTT
jgi:long-chain acyl-CoA synthetase